MRGWSGGVERICEAMVAPRTKRGRLEGVERKFEETVAPLEQRGDSQELWRRSVNEWSHLVRFTDTTRACLVTMGWVGRC